MKPTTLFAAAAAGLFLFATSCERHEWEETRALHEMHVHDDSHGEGDHHDHDHGAESHAEGAEDSH